MGNYYNKDEKLYIPAEIFKTSNKTDFIIFKVDSSKFEYNKENLKKMIIPFDKFFVETPIYVSDGEDCYMVFGFFVIKCLGSLSCFYIWSTAINDRNGNG